MEISKEEWVVKAKDNVQRFLQRGGHNKGDEEQLLDGVHLANTIGYALSLKLKDPKEWTDEDKELEDKQNFCYYVGEQRETIDKIIDKIYDGVNVNVPCRLVILPIELYVDGKIFEVPLFRYRFQGQVGGDTNLLPLEWKFVDSIGRFYSTFDDFLKNNKYPAAEYMVPAEGHLIADDNGEVQILIGKTPAYKNYYLKALDIATGIIGIAGATGAIFMTGGIAAPFMAASIGSAIYATGRSLDILRDKTAHKETLNPLLDGEARTAWLSLTAHVITFGTMGHIATMTNLATTGHSIAISFKVCNFINETGNIISDLVICDTLSIMHSNYYAASIETRLAHAASICFWTKSYISIKNCENIMHNNAIVALQLFGFDYSFCQHFDDPRSMDIGLRIMTNSMRHNIEVMSSVDQKTIKIDRFSMIVSEILEFEPNEIEGLFDILAAIPSNDHEQFNQLRMSIRNDVNLFRLIDKESKSQAINCADLISMLLKFYTTFIIMRKFKITVLYDAVHEDECLLIGNGFKLTIISAYDIFILRTPCSWPLMSAILELTAEECERLNNYLAITSDNYYNSSTLFFDTFGIMSEETNAAKIKVQILEKIALN